MAAERTRARAAGVALQLETEALVARLAAAGIAARPLKGPALAELAHGDVGLRRSGDIDLLVSRAALHDAVALLVADGYAPPADPVDREGLPALHFRLEGDRRTPVELHWRVHWYEERFAAALLERDDPVDAGAALLVFYARDGFYGLRLAADVAGWYERHGRALGPGLLDARIRKHPELDAVWRTAAYVAQRVVGVPASAWLSAPGLHRRRSRLAARLSNWSQTGERDQLSANLTLVDALLAPRRAWRGAVARELRTAPGSRAVHGAKTAVRAGVALGRVRRGWWAPTPVE